MHLGRVDAGVITIRGARVMNQGALAARAVHIDFATHYLEGGLGLTIVMRDPANGARYLVYLNRSQVDLLRGFFGGLTRGVLEARLKRQAPQVVRGLRMRLESGTPPETTF